jgi:plastocyanin
MKVQLTMAIAGLTLIAGCSSSNGAHATAKATPQVAASASASAAIAPEAAGVAILTISGSSFGLPITVNPGEPVQIVNKDSVAHTVISGKDIDVKVDASGRASFTAPTVPGSYPLTCKSLPSMHGTLIVRGV